MYHAETIDVAVIGGGHAGCEAALAAARLGMRTVLFAISLDSIAMMPCNPSIGGSSKGHLVREVDALGGEMGKVIDKTYIQTKMLNTGKGPAVYSLRAQADKQAYQSEMKHRLENTPNLKIKQAEIVDIRMENGRVSGVVTAAGAVYDCKAAVLCMGTYMKARCLTGEHITESGPNNLMPATKLSARLREMGIDLFRFKTGTPARMNKNSLDLEKMQPQYEDLNRDEEMATSAQLRMIEGLWRDLAYYNTDKYAKKSLRKFLKSKFKVDDIMFLTRVKACKVIQAITAIKKNLEKVRPHLSSRRESKGEKLC